MLIGLFIFNGQIILNFHWRNKFEGKEHVQLFLHYVRADGPKAWAFFDKQQQQEPTPPSTDLPVTIL